MSFDDARSEPVDYDPFASGDVLLTVPATPEQEEIWLSVALGGDDANRAFNESVTLVLRGELDARAVEDCCGALVERHEALRMTVSPDGSTLSVAASIHVRVFAREASEPADSRTTLARAVADEAHALFDLEHGPLVRFSLLRLGPTEHALIIAAHHIVCDGWSLGLLVHEFCALYDARVRRDSGERDVTPQLAEPHRFSDYALERRRELDSPSMREAERYWLDRFAGELPVVDLPTDRPRPAGRTFDAARLDVELDATLVAATKAAARSCGVSHVAFLFGAFEVWLGAITRNRCVVVGLPAAGQAATGYDTLVGHCVRTLPIRGELAWERTVREHLAGVRGRIADASEHQAFAFGSLVKALALPRDPSRIPLVPVLFNLDHALELHTDVVGELSVELRSNARAFENFELSVNATEHRNGITLEATYNTNLFDDATVRHRMDEYRAALAAMAADVERPLETIALLGPDARTRVIDELGRGRTRATPSSFLDLFARAAAAHPDSVAVAPDPDSPLARALTYAELDRASNQLARHLVALGVRTETTVGIMLDRSPRLLVALLAVMKAGGAYVPLDRDYPRDRLELVARDVNLRAVITEAALVPFLPETGARRVRLDADADAVALQPDVALAAAADDDDDEDRRHRLAYVLHTSGSTGTPKGVAIEHGTLASFLVSMAEDPGIEPNDTLVAVTTLSFDIAALELLLPLTVGARVVVASRETARDGAALCALLASARGTLFQATPSTLRLMVDAGLEPGEELTVLSGGEALPPELARALVSRAGRVFNMYGPTETTVWSTLDRVEAPPNERAPVRITIGRPIANTRVYVLDERGSPTPLGVPGELFIGGENLARGYWNRPELTGERFVPDPFAEARVGASPRMYRTGDLVRMNLDGRLEWIGRVDAQVKLRGHRIELGEVESVVASLPAVRDVCALVHAPAGSVQGDERIVVYVTPAHPVAPRPSDVRDHAAKHLPPYMVPHHVVVLDAMPRTANGKVDRKALPAPAPAAEAGLDEGSGATSPLAPRTPTEARLAAMAAELLGLRRVPVDASFFDLGGHSMLATRLASRVRAELGLELSLRRIFEAPTVAAMAAYLDATRDEAVHAPSSTRTDHEEREEFAL